MKVRVVLLALTLAACSRSQPEAPVSDNYVEPAASPTPAPSPTARATPTPEPVIANTSAELPAEPRADTSEQVMDDASTTGMTARANRDEEEAAETVADNEAQ